MTDTTKRDAVREKVVALQDLADDLHAEIKRLRAIYAALREPSEGMQSAMFEATRGWLVLNLAKPALRAALRVAAAEQEVDRG